jgi:hypothetical protein
MQPPLPSSLQCLLLAQNGHAVAISAFGGKADMAVLWVYALATIELWRRAARRPEKLKRKFRNRLWRSKPITPKHEPPPPLKEGLFVREAELQFFSDFEDFANVINSWLGRVLINTGLCPNVRSWGEPEMPGWRE